MVDTTTLESSLALGAISVLGALAVIALGRRRHVVVPSLITLLLHFVSSLLFYRTNGLFSPDAQYYHGVATALASDMFPPDVTAGKEGWPNVLAVTYRLFGADPQVGLWLNSLAAAILVIVLAEVSFELGLPVKLTAWMSALLPSLFIWSSLLLREAVTWMLISLMVLGVVKLNRSARSLIGWMFLAGAFFGLLSFRGTAALLVLGALIAAFLFVARRGPAFVVATLAVTAVAVVPEVSARVAEVLGTYSVQQVELSREALSRNADSAFAVSSGGGLLQSAVSAVPRVLFGPFPWEWSALGALFVVDAIVWITILGLAVRGLLTPDSPRAWMLLVIPAAVLLLVLAVTSGNYGTLIRLRLQAGVLLIPLAAMGLTVLLNKSKAASTLRLNHQQARFSS